MTYNLLSVDAICSTGKTNAVCLNVADEYGNRFTKWFITNDESNDGILDNTKNPNKACLCLHGLSSIVIHNIYDSSTPFYKSPIYDVSPDNRSGTTYDFKNVFQHEKDNLILNAVNTNDVIYSITPESEYGHSVLGVDSYSYLSIDNAETTLPNRRIRTLLYDRDAISCLSEGLSTIQDIGEDGEIKKTINGVFYSSIMEMPGNIQNDFDSGNIAATSFKTKNQYSSEYSMEHTPTKILSNCRRYTDIGQCNNQIYLKYTDSVDYRQIQSQNGNPKAVTVYKRSRNTGKYDLKIQSVELIHQIGRYVTVNARHTTLYSLTLNTDILSQLVDESVKKIRENLMNEMKNGITKIVNNIAPVQTQLFEVTINNI